MLTIRRIANYHRLEININRVGTYSTGRSQNWTRND